MGTGNTQSVDALRPELWHKELFKDIMDGMYFTQNGMMGEGNYNVIKVLDDLSKAKGDTVTCGLVTKMSGNGVSGDRELEGNEEKLDSYSGSIAIDQKRFAVRLIGKLDEQKNAFNFRTEAKEKLTIRLQEFIERQVLLKLGGVTLVTLTDVNGVVIGADASWSNTPTKISDTDTTAGYGARYICANTSGAASLAATDTLTPAIISKAKLKAKLANPQLLPIRIKNSGKDWYVMYIHPWQAYDLKRNAEFTQAQREALPRGVDHPLFSGMIGHWDGVIIHEHEYVPYLDISAVGYNFNQAAAGTQYGADCARAILCGQSAAVFAKCKNDNGWVEESFDYKNKTGFATGLIAGIEKVMFNSKEYGAIAVDTGVTAQL